MREPGNRVPTLWSQFSGFGAILELIFQKYSRKCLSNLSFGAQIFSHLNNFPWYDSLVLTYSSQKSLFHRKWQNSEEKSFFLWCKDPDPWFTKFLDLSGSTTLFLSVKNSNIRWIYEVFYKHRWISRIFVTENLMEKNFTFHPTLRG